ncbi:MAG: 3-phosphoshikimate 1-carboxyvinyltransferase [Actinobacteria bacterium]|nr:3-phosphoshikimate 1-carboxyvinyltransferase [Actinomycetota bacterium]
MLVVDPGGPLRGSVRVPGDKSISHRVLMLAALADGTSVIRGLSDGQDVRCTLSIVGQLGAEVDEGADGTLRIRGGRLHGPDAVLDVGNSGTAIRLLAGMLAGLPFRSVLDGDASIRRRPMDRVLVPLAQMGARVSGVDGSTTAPLTIEGGGLSGIDYEPPVASAQVKGCVLLAGLSADGPTTVVEPVPTRAHTEELFVATGLEVVAEPGRVTVAPGMPRPFEHDVEGDPSQAAFWAVAASIVPDSEIIVRNVYRGQGRNGFVDVLQRMGADVVHDPVTGDLTVRAATLDGTVVGADEVPGLVDEIPVLAVAAACAGGETRFEGVAELRVKESDRLATVEEFLGVMGIAARTGGDVLVVEGGRLRGGSADSHQDHRIAMAAAVAALVADGPTTIDGWESVATSYPGFADDLSSLRLGGG